MLPPTGVLEKCCRRVDAGNALIFPAYDSNRAGMFTTAFLIRTQDAVPATHAFGPAMSRCDHTSRFVVCRKVRRQRQAPDHPQRPCPHLHVWLFFSASPQRCPRAGLPLPPLPPLHPNPHSVLQPLSTQLTLMLHSSHSCRLRHS